jgi:hypothetical protein
MKTMITTMPQMMNTFNRISELFIPTKNREPEPIFILTS